MSCEFESHSLHLFTNSLEYCRRQKSRGFLPAAIAQLVEHDLAKVGVASSSLVCRSNFFELLSSLSFEAAFFV